MNDNTKPNVFFKKNVLFFNEIYTILGPGRVAQLVRALSQHTKVAGLIPGRGPYKNQTMNA